MKKLDFRVPFTGFCWHNFFSDFAAVHTYLTAAPDARLDKLQEDYYFLFETLCGASSTLLRTDDDASESAANIDFCMGLAGYTYAQVTEDLRGALEASINAGYPVIGHMRDRVYGPTRVLVGYDGGVPIMSDTPGAQKEPPAPPTYAEMDCLWVITGRCAPTRTLADGLRRIEEALTASLDGGFWDGLAASFDYWRDLKEAPIETIKTRFDAAKAVGWNFDHCHNFAETFRHRVHPALQDSRLDAFCAQIDRSYDSAHDLQWTLIALHDCRDWSKKRWQSLEAGMCMCVRWTIERLKQNDVEVLDAIRGMLAVLEG